MKKLVTIIFILVLTGIANSSVSAQNKGNLNKTRKEDLKVFKSLPGFKAIVLDEVTELKYDSKIGKMTEYVKTIRLEAGKTYDLDFIVDQTFPGDGLFLRLLYKDGDTNLKGRESSVDKGFMETKVLTNMRRDFKFTVNRTTDFMIKVWGGTGKYFKDGLEYTKRSGYIGVILAEMDPL